MIQYIPDRMETPPMEPPAREPLPRARRTAIHLEVRDQYASTDPDFLEWCEGRRIFTPDNRADWREGWHDVGYDGGRE
ncbi:DUF6879 family protein [Streptomyces sp. NBC_01433]|uniref:DUF6879 family protein n=1 Tax=Streptomyces sp. NBC_01433 TaxID=2903864 RepID=UPI00338DEC8E